MLTHLKKIKTTKSFKCICENLKSEWNSNLYYSKYFMKRWVVRLDSKGRREFVESHLSDEMRRHKTDSGSKAGISISGKGVMRQGCEDKSSTAWPSVRARTDNQRSSQTNLPFRQYERQYSGLFEVCPVSKIDKHFFDRYSRTKSPPSPNKGMTVGLSR